jgi:NAD(P)-dependent dehydrogenase (short-subunit alcohol dehydrogenase family)
MDIQGKRVVVTGAASGIGKALVLAFHKHGASKVVSVDINKADADTTAKEVNGLAIEANVGDEQDIQRVVTESTEWMGGIDIFCSNAGIMGEVGLLDTSTEKWQKIWEVNVMAHIFAAKAVLPQMLERGEGYLMNTASAAGLLTTLGAAPYTVTKSAAVSFAEWIKITYGEKGIGVSCLCPQAVRTAMTQNGPGVAGVDGMLEPDAVAEEVLNAIQAETFLVTPHAEVLEYVKRKANDRDRWITGMQRLQKQFEDFLTPKSDK